MAHALKFARKPSLLSRRTFAALGITLAMCVNANAAPAAAPRVKFVTNLGEFTVEVYPDKAPKTVENFLQYVNSKIYNGTIFHRVIRNFMVQGGGVTADLYEKPTRPPIVLEANNGLKNERGTIAMAREAAPNTATSQFFINVVDNPALNAGGGRDGYAVFGKVVSGMAVVDKIRNVPTTSKLEYQNLPTTPVTIQSVTLIK